MRCLQCFRLILVLAFLGAGAFSIAKEPIAYEGGDGSSAEKAIIIKNATEETGVKAEYAYLAKHFPGYKRGKQSLVREKNRMYDVLEVTTAEGKALTIFFDITEFFGK
jgi:hypothetical protein